MRKIFNWISVVLAITLICIFIAYWITGAPADWAVRLWAIGGAMCWLNHNVRLIRDEAD